MLFKSTGIVFRFTRYGETSIIVTIFTSQFGLQSYMVNGVRSKSGKGKIALYQPLTLLELVVYHKESATLSRIKEAKCLRPYRSIYRDVHKTTIALFIEEILNKSVKEESHASELCNFLVDALTTLDEMPKAENFHLVFLLKLSRHLGFQPLEVSEVVGGRVMDFGEDDALKELLQADFDTPLTLTQQQRRNLLDALLRFYSMHVENFGQVKSLAVLREILN